MSSSRPLLAVVACLVATSFAACSSEDDGGPVAASPGGDTDCTTSLTATYPDGTSVDLDESTAAVQLGGGSGYTVYATDFELDTAGIGTATVRPPAGKHLASIFIAPVTQGDAVPIEPGTTVRAGQPDGSLALGIILYSGEKDFGTASAPTGSTTIEGVTANRLCLSIDYTDDEKSLAGTVSAEVFDSPF